jgi:hypothetical protein
MSEPGHRSSASFNHNKAEGNREICNLHVVAHDRRGWRLVCRHDVCTTGDWQGAALSPTHDGPAQRDAKAAGRADHEDFERRDWRALQPADARAKKVFNDQQIVDLTAVGGNYVMVAMLLAMAEETVPPGKEPPFKVGEK